MMGKEDPDLLPTLLSSLPDIIFKFDANLTFTFCHANDPDLLILPAEAFLGKKIVETLPSPFGDLVISKIKELQRKGEPLQFEYPLPLPLGQKWFEARMLQSVNDEVVCIVRNITDKKNSEIEYHSILETTQDGFWINDTNGIILEVNTAYSQMIGFPKDEIVGEPIAKFEAIEDQKVIADRIQKLLKFGKDHFESKHRHKDGNLIDVEISVNFVPLAGGRFTVFVRNITERKKLEQLIFESKNRYEELTNQISVGVYTYRSKKNGDQGFEFVSKRFCELLNFKLEDLAQDPQRPFSFIYAEDLENFIHKNSEATRSGNSFSIEARFVVKDNVKWFRVESMPSPQANGDILWNGVLTDINDKKLTEELLIYTSEQAEAANRAKSEFLANMSHEIRTPLNGVIGFQDLLMETKLTQEQKHYIENASNSAHSLLSVINDILDFSKIEAGKIELEELYTDLYLLVENSIDIVKFSATKKKIRLCSRIQPGIPQFIKIDSTRIKQVLVNLLGNAIKFTKEGEVRLNVSFSFDPTIPETFGYFKFSVTDTGIGIDKDKQGLLFHPFSQADSSITRNFGGTGLGLIISNSFIEKMGSTIKLESEEGQGSKFHFELRKEFQIKPDYFSFQNPFKQALVIDPDTKHVEIVQEVLKSWSIGSVTSSNAKEALQILEQRPEIDLVIIDYEIVETNEASYCDQLRQVRTNQKIDILLVYNSTNIVNVFEKSRKASISYRIMKPLKVTELYHLLKQMQGEATEKDTSLNQASKVILKDISPTILIVEDVSVNMMLLKGILSRAIPKAKILEAVDGKQAVEIAFETHLDLVLMDIQMPIKDGYQASRELRLMDKHGTTPIIALTAGVLVGDKEKCIEAGMTDYLSKPIDRKLLLQKLETLLVPN